MYRYTPFVYRYTPQKNFWKSNHVSIHDSSCIDTSLEKHHVYRYIPPDVSIHQGTKNPLDVLHPLSIDTYTLCIDTWPFMYRYTIPLNSCIDTQPSCIDTHANKKLTGRFSPHFNRYTPREYRYTSLNHLCIDTSTVSIDTQGPKMNESREKGSKTSPDNPKPIQPLSNKSDGLLNL